jgi:drug/metabolite transporter (DMT)-like permease
MVAIGSLFVGVEAIERYPIGVGQAIRCSFATLLLLAIGGRALRSVSKDDLPLLALLSITGVAGYNAITLLAVRHADPAAVGVIVSCVPVVVALVSPLLRRRTPSSPIVLAALIVASGAVAVQYTGGSVSVEGVLLAVVALSLEVAFSLLAVPLLRRMSPIAVATHSSALAIPLCLVAGLLLEDRGAILEMTSDQALALLYLGVVAPIGFVLLFAAIDELGVERAALFYGLLPVTVLVTAGVISGTEITPGRIIGCALVVVGISFGMRSTPPVPAS